MVNLVSLGQKNLKYYGSELIITPPDGVIDPQKTRKPMVLIELPNWSKYIT